MSDTWDKVQDYVKSHDNLLEAIDASNFKRNCYKIKPLIQRQNEISRCIIKSDIRDINFTLRDASKENMSKEIDEKGLLDEIERLEKLSLELNNNKYKKSEIIYQIKPEVRRLSRIFVTANYPILMPISKFNEKLELAKNKYPDLIPDDAKHQTTSIDILYVENFPIIQQGKELFTTNLTPSQTLELALITLKWIRKGSKNSDLEGIYADTIIQDIESMARAWARAQIESLGFMDEEVTPYIPNWQPTDKPLSHPRKIFDLFRKMLSHLAIFVNFSRILQGNTLTTIITFSNFPRSCPKGVVTF